MPPPVAVESEIAVPDKTPESPGNAPSVLLVDDQPNNLLAMEAALAPLGVRLVRASTPAAALEAIRNEEFAVVLLDVQMPEMDGYEVARRIMEQDTVRRAPVIFVTALDQDRRHVHAGYESGAVDFLFKPLDPDELRAKVQAFVRMHTEREAEAARERRRYADLTGAAQLAAEQQAARILESITDAFYALDSEFRFTYVNRKAEDLWNCRREELLGQCYWTIFPQAIGSFALRMHQQAMADRRPVHFEVRSAVIDRWIAVSLYPEAGGGLSCYFQDISARKEVEAEREQLLRELEAQRSRLASVFRHAPAFLAVLRGPEYVFELANDAYYQLVGHRELIGKPVFEAMPEVRGQGFEAMLDRVVDTGEPFFGREMPILLQRTHDAPQVRRFLDFAYLPLIEASGACTGVIAHGLDVTDHVIARKEAERARDRIARLQAITSALAGANTPEEVADVVVSQVVAATGAATGMLALRDSDAPNGVMTLRTDGFTADFEEQWYRSTRDSETPALSCIRTNRAIFLESREALLAEFPVLVKLWDQLGTCALSTVPLAVAGETVGAMSFTFTEERTFPEEDRDFFLTLGRQAALALERARLFGALTQEREVALVARSEAESARTQAEAAAAAKSQFLATMSHELRTPINAQIGYTQLLEMGLAGPLTAEQRDYLTRLSRSSEHLLMLVNDVLDLSKIEAGELTPHRELAWTGPAADAALELTRPLADARGVQLVDERPNDAGVSYVGDEQRVRQVLLNLLSNAVKFTETGGRITVSCGTAADAPAAVPLHGHGPWAWIRVADTGIGITVEQLGRIFDPFHQVDASHTRKAGGTGLGLAISRRLARLMGGELTAESDLGRGSTFTLWLPATTIREEHEGSDASESPTERRARAEPGGAALETPGLDRIGELLRAATDEVLTAYVDRLRVDPEIPRARAMRRAELEDHAVSFVADLAQSLLIIGEGAGPEMLRDGNAIQRTIAEHHGTRRHAQGWTEQAVRRDHEVMRTEIERAVRRQLRASSAQSSEARMADAEAAVSVLLSLVNQAESISLRAWRRAEENGGSAVRKPG